MNEISTHKGQGMVQSPNQSGANHREMAKVQGAIVMARRFPRIVEESKERILDACTRPKLAEVAMYAYPRGGVQVEGPSIRLAEVLALNWGNMQFGIAELTQTGDESTLEAFAWDLETNVYASKTFQVPHVRWTRDRGRTKLEDPRDIYEIGANLGARRQRACILAVIPGDIVDAAVGQCAMTLQNALGAPAEALEAMAGAFEAEFGVTPELIQKRLGKPLKSVIGADVVRLKQIFQSMRDGLSKPHDWFAIARQSDRASDLNEALDQASIERAGSGGGNHDPRKTAGVGPDDEAPPDLDLTSPQSEDK